MTSGQSNVTGVLGDREQQLVDRHPDVDWDSPQPVSVPGQLTRLTCRFCTALNGLKASELDKD